MLYAQVEIKEYVNIVGTQNNNNAVFKFFTIFFQKSPQFFFQKSQ